MTNINNLELTGENLATNYVIQSLPIEYKKELLAELKTTYKGEIKFTWEQAQKVYTASIGLNHEEHEQKVSENRMQHSQVVLPPNNNNDSRSKRGSRVKPGGRGQQQLEQPEAVIQQQPWPPSLSPGPQPQPPLQQQHSRQPQVQQHQRETYPVYYIQQPIDVQQAYTAPASAP